MLKHIPALGGRTLVADADYETGDLIVDRECPLLSFPLSNYEEDSPLKKKVNSKHYAKVMTPQDMAGCLIAYFTVGYKHDLSDFYTSDDTPHIDLVVNAVCKYCERTDFSRLRQFILSILCNAHVLEGSIRLYSIISKMAHSCQPNVTLIFHEDGRLDAYANRPICKDEPLCFSYLSESLASPRGLILGDVNVRRDVLASTKFFHCQCKRCEDEEKARFNTIPTDLICQIASAFADGFGKNSLQLVNWAQLKQIDVSTLSDYQNAAVSLALALHDLVLVPEAYGWGIAISENLLQSGVSALLRVGTSLCETPILCTVHMYLPIVRGSLERLPKSFKMPEESKAGIDRFMIDYANRQSAFKFLSDS